MDIRHLALLTLVGLTPPILAQEGDAPSAEVAPAAGEAEAALNDALAQRAAFEASLTYKQGEISLQEGLATLRVPESFRYLDAADTDRVLQAWGNPPDPSTLGMLVPADMSPMDKLGWGVIISYEEDGHVDDEDAADMDFDELLEDMKKGTLEGNKARQEAGYGAIELKGWAEPPHYDGATHKLYWAQELAFQGNSESSLNYDIRVLGRKGVLVLSAVSSISQLSMMKEKMPEVLAFTDFNPGHSYADFDPDTDQLAAYGIGALVAGKVAAKAGLFKTVLALLVAGKKLVVVGIVALIAGIKRFFNIDDRAQK